MSSGLSAARLRRLAVWLLGHRLFSIVALILLTSVSFGLATQLQEETGYDVYFERGLPLHAQIDELKRTFVNDDLLFVVYENENIFSQPILSHLRAMEAALRDLHLSETASQRDNEKDIAFVDRVESIASVDDLVGSDLSFQVEPLVPDPVPVRARALADIRKRAYNNPLIRESLIGSEGRGGVLSIRLVVGLSSKEKLIAVTKIRRVLRAYEASGSIGRFHLIGATAVEADMGAYQARDLVRFVPIVFALMIVSLYAFTRRLRTILIAVFALFVCLATGSAALVLTKSTLNSASSLIPPFMMALCTSMLIHYFSEYGQLGMSAKEGCDPKTEALIGLIPPVAMTVLTTAIGTGSLVVSRIPALRDFGSGAAIGLLAAFMVVTVSVVLAFSRWRPKELMAEDGVALSRPMRRFVAWLGDRITTRPVLAFILSIALSTVVVSGMFRVVVDQDQIEFFARDTPLRQADAAMQRVMGGRSVVVVSIRGPRAGHFLDPNALAKVEELERYVKRDLKADQIISLIGYLKLMHREYLAGDQSFYRLPETSQQVAQLLMINNDDRVDEYVDHGRRRLRLVIRMKESSAAELLAVYRKLDVYLARHFPRLEGYEAFAAADSRKTASLVNDLIHSQILSIALSGLLIFAAMFAVLRSLRLGLCAMIPNVVPILVGIGVLGWTGITLNAATVMISTVALGIAVDDTIHFMHFLRGRLLAGCDMAAAVRETLRTKGPAIIGTSLVITVAFAALTQAELGTTRQFSLLMTTVMISAAFADLVLLPSLLMVVGRDWKLRSDETVLRADR